MSAFGERHHVRPVAWRAIGFIVRFDEDCRHFDRSRSARERPYELPLPARSFA